MDEMNRFWSKVVKDTPNECWLWRAARSKAGYGLFWLGGARWAHRVSYEFAHGPIPSGLDVRHKCDIPNCVNPAHLELGTQADNNQDMVLRRRHKGVARAVLAAQFGVGLRQIDRIINFQSRRDA